VKVDIYLSIITYIICSIIIIHQYKFLIITMCINVVLLLIHYLFYDHVLLVGYMVHNHFYAKRAYTLKIKIFVNQLSI